jgi:hypothetical protein
VQQQEHSWNLTTKEFCQSSSSSSYGCKGEAIAAISTICDLAITTKPIGSDSGYCTVVSPRVTNVFADTFSACVLRPVNRAFQGTTVAVSNIFHNIPVRRASVRRQQEVLAVETFVRQVALLFHDVEFAVLDRGRGHNAPGGDKYIIHYPPVESVASRLVGAHGQGALSKMTVRILCCLCDAISSGWMLYFLASVLRIVWLCRRCAKS